MYLNNFLVFAFSLSLPETIRLFAESIVFRDAEFRRTRESFWIMMLSLVLAPATLS